MPPGCAPAGAWSALGWCWYGGARVRQPEGERPQSHEPAVGVLPRERGWAGAPSRRVRIPRERGGRGGGVLREAGEFSRPGYELSPTRETGGGGAPPGAREVTRRCSEGGFARSRGSAWLPGCCGADARRGRQLRPPAAPDQTASVPTVASNRFGARVPPRTGSAPCLWPCLVRLARVLDAYLARFRATGVTQARQVAIDAGGNRDSSRRTCSRRRHPRATPSADMTRSGLRSGWQGRPADPAILDWR